jgi:hypothetical protein
MFVGEEWLVSDEAQAGPLLLITEEIRLNNNNNNK